MFKVSMDLFRIHKSFKVQFTVLVREEGELDTSGKPIRPTVSLFNYNGSNYIKVSPFPFINIDISSKLDKGEEWNSNRSFNMNRREFFTFAMHLQKLVRTFTVEKGLFYYDKNQTLRVNHDLAEQHKQTVVCSNKSIMMRPIVVENEESHELYEGIVFFVNTLDFFSCITYGEAEYLLFELKRIDFNTLTMELLNMHYLKKKEEFAPLSFSKPLIEEEVEDLTTGGAKSLERVPSENAIPEI